MGVADLSSSFDQPNADTLLSHGIVITRAEFVAYLSRAAGAANFFHGDLIAGEVLHKQGKNYSCCIIGVFCREPAGSRGGRMAFSDRPIAFTRGRLAGPELSSIHYLKVKQSPSNIQTFCKYTLLAQCNCSWRVIIILQSGFWAQNNFFSISSSVSLITYGAHLESHLPALY